MQPAIKEARPKRIARRRSTHRTLARPRLVVAFLPLALLGSGCETLFTEVPPAGNDFESPFEKLPEDLNAVFLAGDENFEKAFSVTQGLGPIFNNFSCAGCHPGDGRGTPSESLIRFSRSAADLAFDLGGPQLQDKAIPGISRETLPAGVQTSTRLPPAVFGVGLIEAIPESEILSREDPQDLDGDGISGRANRVNAAEFVPAIEAGSGMNALGRFGRKANVSNLLEQVVTAYHQDIGVTSDFLPVENPNPQAGSIAIGDAAADPEIPARVVLETLTYVRLLAPPDPGAPTPETDSGGALFEEVGCAKCHVPMLRTGRGPIEALSGVDVFLYSDLLLHDMGEGLADNRADGLADGREWRTAPLWGTRVVPDFLGGKTFFLHDGRALSIHEAIVAHGGEGQASRDAYLALGEAEQEALREFVRTR
jgi:CxxC motif-containing protein (DUF1111 family)